MPLSRLARALVPGVSSNARPPQAAGLNGPLACWTALVAVAGVLLAPLSGSVAAPAATARAAGAASDASAESDAKRPPSQPKEKGTPGPAKDGAERLFDGKTLRGWKVVDEFDFKEHGKVYVKDGRLVLAKGKPLTGVKWTGKFPRMDYEVSLEAMRVEGDDFFCSMVFPIGKQVCSITFGGWGGSMVGLTNVDGEPAAENETAAVRDFENNHWYHLRFRVTRTKIEAWIDKDKVVDFPYKDRKLTIRWEQESILPFGLSSYRTTAAMRNITVRPVADRRSKAPDQPR